MAERTEFEEPEYEGPLYNQLLSGNLRIWTPGRIFERVIGIDAGIYANNPYFWSLFGQQVPIRGVNLRHYNLLFLWRFLQRRIRPFPSFYVNLLIQSKRPEHRNGVNAYYAQNGIRGQYWQFQIKRHQQSILESLEVQFGNNALVIYACPTFHKFRDLDRLILQGQIVENSTFVKPSILHNHSKWVYDTPGTVGLACSKIEYHKDEPFQVMLDRLLEIAKQRNEQDYHANIAKLDTITNNICENEPKNPILIGYKRRNEILKNYINEKKEYFDFEDNKEFDTFIKFLSFIQFTSTVNIDWFTIE